MFVVMTGRSPDYFPRIARRYDLANTVLTGGSHQRWKRRAVAAAEVRPGQWVLDAGTGTGDLARLATARGARVIGVDLAPAMLAIARRRGPASARWVVADVAALPFRAGTFDVVLTGFTLRHPASLDGTLRELRRVLAPGGRLVVLEFGRPPSPLVRALYRLYAAFIPAIGGALTGHRAAYAYLVRSIRRFPPQHELAARLRAAGFDAVAYRNLTGGIAAIHIARAPQG
jgi:demethylmenaquinone methyltransferase/2-methoxy-6-polyprenyl-1,4-benzoquinol methylase